MLAYKPRHRHKSNNFARQVSVSKISSKRKSIHRIQNQNQYLTLKSSSVSSTRHKLIHKPYEKPQWKFEKHFYNIYVQLNTHSYLSERFFITIHTLQPQLPPGTQEGYAGCLRAQAREPVFTRNGASVRLCRSQTLPFARL